MRTSKYTKERIEEAVAKSRSFSETLRQLGIQYISGSMSSYIKSQVARFGIDYSHFSSSGWAKGTISKKRLSLEDIFVIDRNNGRKEYTFILRRAMIEYGKIYQCEVCKIRDKWMERPLILEMDHINGNPLDNNIDNLRFLCPNCHSQAETSIRIKSPKKDKFCTCGKRIWATSKNCISCSNYLKNNNPKKLKILIRKENRDCMCGNKMSHYATHCKSCDYKTRKNNPRPSARKVERPSREELQKLLWEKPTAQIAKDFKVSDVAVAKWAKSYGIQKPPRGYWQKVEWFKI